VPKRNQEQGAEHSRSRIEALPVELSEMDYVCSGTLLERVKTCRKPGCRCARDPAIRHGPYYEWKHMKAGRLIHRLVFPEQAGLLRRAIVNYRRLRNLLRSWKTESERMIDVEADRPEVSRPSTTAGKLVGNAVGDARNVG